MFGYCVKRVLLAIPTLAAVIVVTFTLGFYGPGDPIIAIFGSQPPTPEVREQMRKEYGLDRPYLIQLADYASRVVRGDFGQSLYLRRGVWDAMRDAIPISAQLGLTAFIVLAVVGFPLGLLAAVRQNSLLDYGIVGLAVGLAATPAFVLIPVVLIVLMLLPGHFTLPTGWSGLLSLKAVFPVIFLALGALPYIVRTVRAVVQEALHAGHVRSARAKGLAERSVLAWHVLRNTLAAVVTALALCVPYLFAGSFFVETILAIPGFGRLSVGALQKYDYPLILGTTIVGATVVIASNLVADIVSASLDPRIRSG